MSHMEPLAAPPPSTQRPPSAYADAAGRAAAIARLHELFGERVATGEAIRRQHANSLTWIGCEPPDAVVFAEATAEVAAVVAIAGEFRLPIIPFGAGTSLEGHVNAPFGGISLDLSRMDRVLAINADDLDCRVEAGISRRRLAEELRASGLFFPVDPGTEQASLGGMAATRASGTTAVRYGTMRDNVLSLTAVMADGSVVRTGSRARKSSSGYDLTRLLVGSEGTLGIITELGLRLFGQPETVIAAVAAFPTLSAASRTTMAAIAMGLGVARIELLDPVLMRAVNAHAKLALAEVPTLFMEVHGTRAAAEEQMTLLTEIARGEGAGAIEWSGDAEARSRLWRARHDALWAIRSAWPGLANLVTDVCVPISRLAEAIAATEADREEIGLLAPIVGHVGDGNFHVLVLFDETRPEQLAAAKAFSERLAERAIAMDGTASGEHGIGQGKRQFMAREHGEALGVMAAIKAALDPHGLLNPGKVLP
ncbi:MAG: FAD-linked oxidase C-terminal domain-containing protein [Hyphomicrobiaceae bacterium]|nr:FAD-linked oxidase C-terminal domain-containing protein [Hyphomicrobiaceae bacterium]